MPFLPILAFIDQKYMMSKTNAETRIIKFRSAAPLFDFAVDNCEIEEVL